MNAVYAQIIRYRLLYVVSIGLICAINANGQVFPTIPPVPSPQPLAGSPGDLAYHELKEHLKYVYNEENAPLTDTVTIPDQTAEWKGLNRFEILEIVRVLAQAQVVVEHGTLEPADRGVPIWIHDIRGYKKPNGWYGIRINGRAVDERRIWFLYAGANVNLRIFCTAGSRMVDPSLRFQ